MAFDCFRYFVIRSIFGAVVIEAVDLIDGPRAGQIMDRRLPRYGEIMTPFIVVCSEKWRYSLVFLPYKFYV
jgi:hypothetical protein